MATTNNNSTKIKKVIPTYTFRKLNLLYHTHEKFTAGIMLEGWEVKALADHNCSLETAYCNFQGKDFLLMGCIITPLKNHVLTNTVTVSETRPRKLLLNKNEMLTIQEKLGMKGFTCIPGKLYKNAQRFWKLEIHLCTGKKIHDKREDLKKKDAEREMRQEG
jgi:SsrA-binding protein